MGRLVFTAICSLDGYVVDSGGDFTWAAPDAGVHAHVNDEAARIGTYLLGRRMWEVLRYWDGPGEDDRDPVTRDYRRLWQGADKVVYSTTLDASGDTAPRTRVEATFDAGAARRLVDASASDVSVGGPTLAARAFAAGLVDEVGLYRHPVCVGGGTAALPAGQRLDLELAEVRTFASGVVFTRHRVRH
ncbi:dihydrofolate reductase family protein [Pedococcus sp. NPDC057267]|uniref:dihydrofolate reductase family protein n=1 Tax=Pedococcus sp. NPDC057267 TaxID=3346077 RepID=UPI00363ACFD4